MSDSASTAVKFGRVGVLMGGVTEREVSLAGGKLVLGALREQGVDAHALIVDEDLVGPLQSANVDRVFNVLHGGAGEGGIAQAILTALNIPYTDSDVLASALALDKIRCKWLWQGLGFTVPDYIEVSPAHNERDLLARFALPFVIKPVCGGSSQGVSIVRESHQVAAALAEARRYGARIMAEQFIDGPELTVGILGEQALPVVRIEAAGDFYDYDAKYLSQTTRYHCPSQLSAQTERKVQDLAMQAFASLGCRIWGRVDLMLDHDEQAWLLEVNTITGMSPTSLVPKAAQVAGISLQEIVWRVLSMTLSGSDG